MRLQKNLRLTFFGLNVLITLVGIALMALSLRSILQRQEFRKESASNKLLVDVDGNATLKMLVTAMTISILLICLSWFGFCGAFGDKKCLLSYYLVFALLNLALVIIGGIVALRFSNIPQTTLSEQMAEYRYNQTSRDFVDNIRTSLACCLVRTIYSREELMSGIENQIVTASCCIAPGQEKCLKLLRGYPLQLERWEDINGIVRTQGCLTQIGEMSEHVSEFIFPFFLLIGIMDLTGLLLSIALCCRI